MRITIRVAQLLIVGLVVLRLMFFLAYAMNLVGSPLEAFFLESKMVHLCWRVQNGLRLYPEWHDGPYVANFFGPLYFIGVGVLARIGNCDLRGVFTLGRIVTLGCVILTAVITFGMLRRRTGTGPALCAALATVGGATLVGFGVMVRPDVAADCLGLLGFILAVSRKWYGLLAGCVCLVAAALTKQTALLYLLAAVTTLGLRGEGKRGALLTAAGAVGLIGFLGVVTWLAEPRLLVDFVGERRLPWSVPDWLRVQGHLATAAPEILVLLAIGVVMWVRDGADSRDLLALLTVSGVIAVVASAKEGADLNYFLVLRIVAACALATLLQKSNAAATRRSGWVALALWLVVVGLLPGTWNSLKTMVSQDRMASFLRSEAGVATLRSYERAFALARDPSVRLLTDHGLIDIQRGERTLFADPWLFRRLCQLGEIRPTALLEMTAGGGFDVVLTRADLVSPSYAEYPYGLPPAVAAAARPVYVLTGRAADLFVYEPGGEAAPQP